MRSVSSATSTRALPLSLAFAGLLCVAALPSTSQAITIGAQASGNGIPGRSVEVQIILIGSNGLVAGMQTDISWDPSCVSVTSGGGDTASCFANPNIPKNLTTKMQSGSSSLRALFFSMSDVDPIKDAVLFTCVFNIDPATTASQCPINLSNVIASDPKGGRLPATAASGVVQITQAGSQHAAPQGGPALAPAPVIVAPGGAAAGSGGQASGGAPAAAAPASGARGTGNTVVQGLPPGQAPAAEEAAGAAGEAVTTPGLLTPAPAVRTVAAAITPSPKAGTPTAGAKTPTVATPKGTPPQTTPTPRSGTPTAAKPTPKKGE